MKGTIIRREFDMVYAINNKTKEQVIGICTQEFDVLRVIQEDVPEGAVITRLDRLGDELIRYRARYIDSCGQSCYRYYDVTKHQVRK